MVNRGTTAGGTIGTIAGCMLLSACAADAPGSHALIPERSVAAEAGVRAAFLNAIDAAKLKSELGWSPAHSFEQGIADTVDWYLEHQPWVQRVLDGSYRLERIGVAA